MGFWGEDIKKFGFGLMRLPKIEGTEKIDVEQTKKMVDMFLEAGFTYFDTAWAYPGSEDAIRQALIERYPREKFKLATKNAAWIACKNREDAIRQFETSLKQTGAGYFDFYLLHNLGEGRTHYFDDFDMWNFVLEKKKEGLIKHVGFSFHSTPEELEEILKAHPEAEFVQGLLAKPPKSVENVLKDAEPNSSCASWAIRFSANLEGVMVVLSGMSNIEQMKDNLSFMKDFTGLSEEQSKVIEKAQEELKKIPIIPCTTCNYCAKVCPMEIGISGSFTALNYLTLYNDLKVAKEQEGWLVGMHGRKKASECVKLCSAKDRPSSDWKLAVASQV